MGVQIAHAMGAEVTVLSQSLKKQEDGLRLGADRYYATSDPETFEKLAGSFDLVLNTVSAALDVRRICPCLPSTAPWSTSGPRQNPCPSTSSR